MIGQNLSVSEQDRLSELMSVDRFRLKIIYWELPTPNIADVDGEYDAQLLDQGTAFASVVTRQLFRAKGPWLGKAFRPLTESKGEGYNAFGDPEDRQVQLRMNTYIDRSYIVPGHSYILDYRGLNRGPITWLRGELRQVSPAVLLGMGTFGPRAEKLYKLRRTIPFVLVRSDRPYLEQKSAA